MQLTLFENQNFAMRCLTDEFNEPWFVGKDIAKALGYKEPHKAILAHVDEDDRIKHPIMDELKRSQDTWIINESGLYSLILRSNKTEAKKFKKWVTSEVLPSIRKHGSYNLQNQALEQKLDKVLNTIEAITSTLTQGFVEMAKANTKAKAEPKCKTKSKQLKELNDLAFVEQLYQVILQNPGINQTKLLTAIGKRRDDKTARAILNKYIDIKWYVMLNGKALLYFPIKTVYVGGLDDTKREI